MAFITIDTLHGDVEGVVFAGSFNKMKHLLVKGNKVKAVGKKSNGKILVNGVELID